MSSNEKHGRAGRFDVGVDAVQWGTLRRVTPISRHWGSERGRPVDRYYIERFLEKRTLDIRGRVLELQDDDYTRRFGGDRVQAVDILDANHDNPRATLVADLANAPQLPSDWFDAIILTQTLQLIYDTRAVLRTLKRILKPGGILLATFPGITRTSREWSRRWFWSFTSDSARQLFSEAFPESTVEIEAHGNVLIATAFLMGLAVEDLVTEEFEFDDPEYEVIITVRVQKGSPTVADTHPPQ